MKRSKYLFVVSILSIFIFCPFGQLVHAQEINVNPKITSYFSSDGSNDSHEQFAGQALKILANDKGEDVAAFYSEYKTHLLQYCDKPDSDEAEYAFAYHFYNPYTQKNFLPSILPGSKITALTKFKEHMTNAVDEYSSDKKESMEELGRSIHFLEDVNVPHHAANLIAGLSSHSQYESYVSKHNSMFFVDTSDAYDKFSNENFDQFCTDILNECAKNAYSYKDLANTYEEENWESAARPTIKLLQEDLASLFYRFEQEVNKQ